MKASLTRHALLLGAAVAFACSGSLAGCAFDRDSAGDGSSPGERGTGTVGLQLTLPGGEAVDTIAYTIHGPNTYSGVVDVSGSTSTVGFVIPGVAPGSGYTIALTATTADGSVTCAGASPPFAVQGNQITRVNVLLECTSTLEAGSVLVDGVGFACASWHTAVANPATTTTGGTVALVGFATGPDPGAITYSWSAPTGTIAEGTSANATFTCPASPGDVTITLGVGDGPVPQGAACPPASSATTITVTCEAPADAGPPDAAGDAASDTGGADGCVRTAATEQCTNGIDDDCNGATDCEDPACGAYVCAPVPDGWYGPLAVQTGAAAAPPASCGGPYFSQFFTLYSVIDAPMNCSPACECGPRADTDCTATVDFAAAYYPSSSSPYDPSPPYPCQPGLVCASIPTPILLNHRYGVSITSCGIGPYGPLPSTTADWFFAGNDGVESGASACTLLGPPPSVAPWSWQSRSLGCAYEGSSPGGGCGGASACVQRPTDAGARVCITREWDQPCPAPFSVRSVEYEGGDDLRSCSCPCSAPSTVPCSVQALVGSRMVSVTDDACHQLNDPTTSVEFEAVTAPGTCPTGGDATAEGEIVPNFPWTICCLP